MICGDRDMTSNSNVYRNEIESINDCVCSCYRCTCMYSAVSREYKIGTCILLKVKE